MAVPSVELNTSELKRRHRTAVTFVVAMFGLTVVFVAVAFAGRRLMVRTADPMLAGALRITIVVFGLGAVALRRTRFSSMRLQDITALQGISGLLATLEKTTVQVATLGGAIAVMGFVVTILSGDPADMAKIGIAAAAVLIYSYPRRSSWERVARAIQKQFDARPEESKGSIS